MIVYEIRYNVVSIKKHSNRLWQEDKDKETVIYMCVRSAREPRSKCGVLHIQDSIVKPTRNFSWIHEGRGSDTRENNLKMTNSIHVLPVAAMLCSRSEHRPLRNGPKLRMLRRLFYLIFLSRMREAWWPWLMCTVGSTGPEEWRFAFCQFLWIFLPHQENHST